MRNGRGGLRRRSIESFEKGAGDMGIELELGVLLALTTLGQVCFGQFEVETSKVRRLVKWTIVDGATIGLYFAAGHWALLFPAGMATAGLVFHLWWCRRNGIHPWRATPRRRYYELRGWAFE
jgi:hypothetical protein